MNYYQTIYQSELIAFQNLIKNIHIVQVVEAKIIEGIIVR